MRLELHRWRWRAGLPWRVAAWFAFVLAPNIARAEGGKVEMRWSAPPSCPSEDEVTDRLEALMGERLDAPRRTRVSAIASVHALGEGFSADIFAVTERGTRRRRLTEADCDRLARATVLIVALAIDPELLATLDRESLDLLSAAGNDLSKTPEPDAVIGSATVVPDPEKEEPPNENPPNQAPSTAHDQSSGATNVAPSTDETPAKDRTRRASSDAGVRSVVPSRRRRGPKLRPALAGGVLLGSGRLPALNTGLESRLSVGIGQWSLHLGGAYWLPTSVTLVGTGGRVTIRGWSLEPGACFSPELAAKLRLPLCLGATLGRQRGSSNGLNRGVTRAGFLGGATARAGFEFDLADRLQGVVGAEGAWLISRPAFLVEGVGAVHRASPAVGGAFAAIQVRLK